MEDTPQFLVNWVNECLNEATQAKQKRMHKNKINWDVYHDRHDFSHKKAGQSQEVLTRQPQSVEQISSFFQQALVDLGDWLSIEANNMHNEAQSLIKPAEIKSLLLRQLEYNDFFSLVGDGVKSGLLSSLMIIKVSGHYVIKPKYVVNKPKKKGKPETLTRIKDKVWQLKLSIVRADDYFPDPTGRGLYEVEQMEMDLHEVRQMAKDGHYDSDVVDELVSSGAPTLREVEKSRETDQDIPTNNQRRKIMIHEFWGDVVDREGNLIHENVLITIADKKHVLRGPIPNPYWHKQSPFVTTPLYSVPNSVWHKAPMDSPTRHNIALTEIYNLMVDGAMKAVQPVTQIRIDALEDVTQISNGVEPGTALKVTSALPPGTKVAEPVIMADIPQDGLNMFNIMSQEYNSSALTNDIRSGIVSQRNVKATEIVEANQTINSVFAGMTKNVETKCISPVARKSWMLLAQYMNDLGDEEVISLFGPERARELQKLSPQKRFAETVSGLKYKVFGISKMLTRNQDYRKLTELFRLVGSSELFLEEFVKEFSPKQVLKEAMSALGLDVEKLRLPESVRQSMEQNQPLEQGATQPGTTPDQLSQQPGGGGLADIFSLAGNLPQSEFPNSPATGGRQQ